MPRRWTSLDELRTTVTVRPVTLDPEAGPGLLMVKSMVRSLGPGEGRFSLPQWS